MKTTPGLLLVVFFVFGWAYYMVATILMQGSIFVPLRNYISAHSQKRRFRYLRSMLGCFMCTATQAALWTLGTTTLVLGFMYGLPETAIALIARRSVDFPWFVEFGIMGMSSFALSLAVAGEAWAIKTIVEHRKSRFRKLHKKYESRVRELLARLEASELRQLGIETQEPKEFIIPKAVFVRILVAILSNNDREKRCPYLLTASHLRSLLRECGSWWEETNGSAPGFACYERIVEEAIARTNWSPLYKAIFHWNHGYEASKERAAERAWEEVEQQARLRIAVAA